jgi:predicted DNA-binding ribbon-helix-helix protein
MRKRLIVHGDRRITVNIEDQFFDGLHQISSLRGISLGELVCEIDCRQRRGSLSSAIRLFVLDFYRSDSAPGYANDPMPMQSSSSDVLDRGYVASGGLPSAATLSLRRRSLREAQRLRELALEVEEMYVKTSH